MRILLLVIVASLLLLPLPLKTEGLLIQSLVDFGHYPLFALISLLMGWLSQQRGFHRRQEITFVVVLPLVFGALIEVLQFGFGRTASFYDFWLDILGVCTGTLVHFSRLSKTWGRPLLGISVITVLALVQPLRWSWAYWEREQALPDILGLDAKPMHWLLAGKKTAPLEIQRVPQNLKLADHYRHMVRIPLHSATWPGIRWREPTRDWRPYSGLTLEIYSPLPDPIDLHLRVHDRQHERQHDQRYEDRFNRTFQLHPGLNRIDVNMAEIAAAPTGRTLDLSAITGIILFSHRLAKDVEVYLLSARLREAAQTAADPP